MRLCSAFLNEMILRPVNVPHAENLFTVQRDASVAPGGHTPSQSDPDYIDLRDKNRTFEGLAAYNIIGSVGVDTGGNHPRRGPIWRAATILIRWESSRIWAATFTLPMKKVGERPVRCSQL